jgi:hypothetical protein
MGIERKQGVGSLEGVSASFFDLLARRASARGANADGVHAVVAQACAPMSSVQSVHGAPCLAPYAHEPVPDASLRSLSWLSCAMATMHRVRRAPASESTKSGALPNRSRAHFRGADHCGHQVLPKFRLRFRSFLSAEQQLCALAVSGRLPG